MSMSDKKSPSTIPSRPAGAKPAATSGVSAGASFVARPQATRIGIVESDKRDKTRTVVLPNPQMHAKYGKIIRKRTVLHVHDEANVSRLGDVVEVASCRPISKTKSWKLVRIVRSGAVQFQAVEVAPVAAKQ